MNLESVELENNDNKTMLMNHINLLLSFLKELEEIKQIDDDDDDTFLRKFIESMKKNYTLLYSDVIKDIFNNILDNWKLKQHFDSFIRLESILYCGALNRVAYHIRPLSQNDSLQEFLETLSTKVKDLKKMDKEYLKYDDLLSKRTCENFDEFYANVFEPCLHKLLDQVSNVTNFILKNIPYLKEPLVIKALNDADTAFVNTVFDCTSRESNRYYLKGDYEKLVILLFLSDDSKSSLSCLE